MLQRYILIWLLLSSGIAFLWPDFGVNFDPFVTAGGPAINVLIVVVMFAVGALLPISEVNQIVRRWPSVLLGTTIQYASMPLLAWLVVLLTKPDPMIAAGLLIVGCVPGAMASNVLTLVARGNVSYSVSLTTSATLFSPLVVPVALALTLGQSVEYDGAKAINVLLMQVVLPVLAGHLASRFINPFRKIAEQVAPATANLAILAIIAIAVGLKRDDVMKVTGELMASLAMINAGGFLAGYAGGFLLRFPEGMRRALTLEVGMQNAGAGTVLAISLFGADSAALIPCIIYTFGCMLTGTILATVWHRLPFAEPEPDAAAMVADVAE
jgi:BASS family bile acid:Na+ symporter